MHRSRRATGDRMQQPGNSRFTAARTPVAATSPKFRDSKNTARLYTAAHRRTRQTCRQRRCVYVFVGIVISDSERNEKCDPLQFNRSGSQPFFISEYRLHILKIFTPYYNSMSKNRFFFFVLLFENVPVVVLRRLTCMEPFIRKQEPLWNMYVY